MNDELLVLATQREQRRKIVDALDAFGDARVVTARDCNHAMMLTEARPPPALRAVAFENDGRMATDALARSCAPPLTLRTGSTAK